MKAETKLKGKLLKKMGNAIADFSMIEEGDLAIILADKPERVVKRLGAPLG